MTRITALFTLLALAACGAAGRPEPPVKPGISFSGTATMGIARNGTS